MCVRVDRSVEGGVACKLPEAGKVRVTCSASVSAQSALEERNSVFADEFVHLSISRLGAQSGDHPPAGESVITHTCGLCAASPHSLGCCFFFSFILLFVGWLVVCFLLVGLFVSGCLCLWRESRLQ